MSGEDDRHLRDEGLPAPDGTQRLDKWLWFARVAKSRTLAAHLVLDGKVRINRARAAKPAQTVRCNDVLTIAVRGNIQVLRVLAPGVRRGPPAEARLLYEALSSSGPAPASDGPMHRPQGSGRPSKREGRLVRRLSGRRD